MKNLINKGLTRVAPRTMQNLSSLSDLNKDEGGVLAKILAYEAELKILRAELNEMRRDNRRTLELYDLVFEKLRNENPL
ncbi:MAG: hypothetical protein ABWX65_01570 [Mycetocola sp.]